MPQPPKTLQFTDWSGGINRTASRPRIRDNQAFWMENLQPIGNGQMFVVPSPGPTRATIAAGIASEWGVVIQVAGIETAYIITINKDGSISSFNPVTFALATIAGPGTVTTACRLTVWEDTHVLFGDPTKGYFSWDGVTFLHYPLALTGDTTATSPVVINMSSTAGLIPGMAISGPDIPAVPGTTILTVDSPTQITLSANATNTVVGEALTVGLGAPSKVIDLAVFEGRVWLLVAPRSITFTAPGSFTDFTTVDAAGSARIIDSIFQGPITRLFSSLELLWLIGSSAVNAISNVQVTPLGGGVVTTFSDTNIVANVGSVLPDSVNSFFRTFLFLSPYGVYAIVGATPQKLSDDLDGLFEGSLDISGPNPSGTFTVNEVFLWAVLVTYHDPIMGPRPILLCFARNAWFVASQGAITYITSVVLPGTGNQQLWATDGTHIFQCFADPTTAIPYTLQTKLWDFGAFTTMKQLILAAVEFENRNGTPIDAQFFAENESTSVLQRQVVIQNSTLQFVNDITGDPITFIGTGPITWIAGTGIQQAKGGCDAGGHYIGVRLTGRSMPFVLSGMALQVEPQGEWT